MKHRLMAATDFHTGQKTLLKEASTLLELFAKTHSTKYDTDIQRPRTLPGGRTRLSYINLCNDDRGSGRDGALHIAACLSSKGRYGADVVEKVVCGAVFVVTKAHQTEIDDWSSQKKYWRRTRRRAPANNRRRPR